MKMITKIIKNIFFMFYYIYEIYINRKNYIFYDINNFVISKYNI